MIRKSVLASVQARPVADDVGVPVSVIRRGLDVDDAPVRRLPLAPPAGTASPPLSAAPPSPKDDLTVQEQAHVRAALRFLRTRAGGWAPLARGTWFTVKTLKNVAYERMPTASMAVRPARFAGVPVDDVIAGRFPPLGACPHCGRGPTTAI